MRQNLTGLTAEAWIYIEEIHPTLPDFWTIIGQEGRFGLVLFGKTKWNRSILLSLGVWGYDEGCRFWISVSEAVLLPTRINGCMSLQYMMHQREKVLMAKEGIGVVPRWTSYQIG